MTYLGHGCRHGCILAGCKHMHELRASLHRPAVHLSRPGARVGAAGWSQKGSNRAQLASLGGVLGASEFEQEE